jgi:hypothetical protein
VVGATCHEVEEAVDSGHILSQCALAVDWRAEPIEQVMNLVFRGAGLVLLEGIWQKTSLVAGRVATIQYQNKTLFFAPMLSFIPTALDEAFWEKVKNS